MLTSEEEQKKREIFEAMSPKRQQRILKKGYDNWNPFLPPKEPFEQIGRKTGELESALSLYHRYCTERKIDSCSTSYLQGVKDICLGLTRGDDRYRGMHDFCCWYREQREETT